MPSSERLKFAHHFIQDGTVDSICLGALRRSLLLETKPIWCSKKSCTSVTRLWLPITSSSRKCPVMRRFPGRSAVTKNVVDEPKRSHDCVVLVLAPLKTR